MSNGVEIYFVGAGLRSAYWSGAAAHYRGAEEIPAAKGLEVIA